MKENKNSEWQKGQGSHQDKSQQDKKPGSCGCPVGSGNNPHKGGSNADERGKNNYRKEGDRNNENRNNNDGRNRKWENE